MPRQEADLKLRDLFIVLVLCASANAANWSEPLRVKIGWADDIVVDRTGFLWCLAYPDGCYKYHDETSDWLLDIETPPFGGPACFDNDDTLWVFNDGIGIRYTRYAGAVWSEGVNIPFFSPSDDHPGITADSGNGVWVGWLSYAFGYWTVACNRYFNGAWGEPQVISNPSEPVDNAFYSIVTDPYGRVWLGWIGSYSSMTLDTFISYPRARCWDSGQWSETMEIAVLGPDVTEFKRASRLRLAPDNEGGMWALWDYWLTSSDTVALEACHWDGEEWTTPETLDVTRMIKGNYPGGDIAVDTAGNVWAVWMHRVEADTGNGDIYYSVNSGKGWSEPAPMNPHPAVDGSPSVIVDGEGRVWCIWASFREVEHAVYSSYVTSLGVEEPVTHQILKPTLIVEPQVGREFCFRVLNLLPPTELEIYDASGRMVKRLRVRPDEAVIWNGCDESGGRLPAGVYFAEVEDSQALPEKIVLLR